MPQYLFLFAYIAVDLPHISDVPERDHVPILVNHRARLIRGHQRLTGQLVMYSLLVCKLKGKMEMITPIQHRRSDVLVDKQCPDDAFAEGDVA